MRPIIHYRPEKNWINDPNGLCQIDGWVHLFYQYNPHGCVWGDMHWGHARSKDMYQWDSLPIAMTPDEANGEIHCFSGSCCKDAEGKPHFFYTSIGRDEDGRDCVNGAQQWHAEPADDDLTKLTQTGEGALLDEIHRGKHVRDWRDPCVIPYEGMYLMVLGGCLEGRGCILLYTSENMRNWTYRHVLLQAEKADNVPWECPNLLMLNGKAVVFWSPCAAVRYAVGTFDDGLNFRTERIGLLDPAGRQGYYAPQAFRDEQGRTILMGWMPECDGDAAAVRRGWSGVMSLPRLLSIKRGNLCAEPLPGWRTMVGEGVPVTADEPMEAGRHFILHGRCRAELEPLSVTMLATTDGMEQTELTLTTSGMLYLGRIGSSLSGEPNKSAILRKVPLNESTADFFLCVDGTALECMVNGQWLSGRVYPTREDAVWLTVQGEDVDLTYYPIKKQ